jgi:hypothetical protein
MVMSLSARRRDDSGGDDDAPPTAINQLEATIKCVAAALRARAAIRHTVLHAAPRSATRAGRGRARVARHPERRLGIQAPPSSARSHHRACRARCPAGASRGRWRPSCWSWAWRASRSGCRTACRCLPTPLSGWPS